MAVVTTFPNCTPCCGGAAPPCCGSSAPFDICVGSDNNLWVTDSTSNSVWRITVSGTATQFTGFTAPRGICAGPDGNLWIADLGAFVWKVTTAGAKTNFTGGSPRYIGPLDICLGPDGNLWMADSGFSAVWKITTSGASTRFPIAASMFSINPGPDGKLWSTNVGNVNTGGGVFKITTSGFGTTCPGGAYTKPCDVCAGPDGNLWVPDFAGYVWKVATNCSLTKYLGFSNPIGVCVGPDDNIWIADAAGFIWKVTTSGVATKYAGFVSPRNLCAGPDGNVWVADQGGYVWKVDPSTGAATPYPLMPAGPSPQNLSTLYATFSGSGNCSCLDGVTITLNYGAGPSGGILAIGPAWYGTGSLNPTCPDPSGNASYVHMAFYCGAGRVFAMQFYCDNNPGFNTGQRHSDSLGVPSTTCNPFFCAFPGGQVDVCCTAQVSLVVS